MKRFDEGLDRGQGTFFPEVLDDFVEGNIPVRVISTSWTAPIGKSRHLPGR